MQMDRSISEMAPPSSRWHESHTGKLASGDGQIHPEMGGIFEMPAIPEMGYPIPGSCAGAFPDADTTIHV